MKISNVVRLACFSLALSAVTPAAAAELIVDGSGNLTGVTGVNVDGILYDVKFVDGTCASVFGSCNTNSFTFTTAPDAQAAVEALLDQVFLDGSAGQFDSDPELTSGCASNRNPTCVANVPVSVEYVFQSLSIVADRAINSNVETSDSVGNTVIPPSTDFALDPTNVWAVFSPSAIPEPSTWAMMLLGFGAIGIAMRRKRKTASLPQLA